MRINKLLQIPRVFGCAPERVVQSTRNLPYYLRTLAHFRRLAPGASHAVDRITLFPILTDKDAQAGIAAVDYFLHDLWAARKIYAARPKLHVDIGSSLEGFVAHLLVFMPVTVIDIRPLDLQVAGLTFLQGDATHLAQIGDDSLESLSSLSALEHFGLGRYGDPIDPDACYTAMRELARVLKPGGRLYIAVPIGAERVCFNAHRIFAPSTILATFATLDLVSFCAVADGKLHEHADPAAYANAALVVGLFEFTKRAR